MVDFNELLHEYTESVVRYAKDENEESIANANAAKMALIAYVYEIRSRLRNEKRLSDCVELVKDCPAKSANLQTQSQAL